MIPLVALRLQIGSSTCTAPGATSKLQLQSAVYSRLGQSLLPCSPCPAFSMQPAFMSCSLITSSAACFAALHSAVSIKGTFYFLSIPSDAALRGPAPPFARGMHAGTSRHSFISLPCKVAASDGRTPVHARHGRVVPPANDGRMTTDD